jgi:hypothetical protein
MLDICEMLNIRLSRPRSGAYSCFRAHIVLPVALDEGVPSRSSAGTDDRHLRVVQLVDLCVGAPENVTTIVTTPGRSVKLGDTAASAKSSV